MANILPVHQMLNPLPDFNATWRQGVEFGQQQKQRSEARGREQQVRNLAPQIVAGDPAAYAQAAAVDPQAAGQFQQAGDAQLRRFKGFVSYIDQAREQAKQSGQWQHVDAALQQAGPYLTQLLGKPGPTSWPQGDPQWEAGWEALKARIAGADSSPTASGVQSTYVDGDGNRVAILRDGSTRILGQNDAGMSQQTLNVDINGVPTQITFDKRTGRYTTAALGAQAPAQPVGAPAGTVIAESGQAMPVTQFTGSDGRPVNIGDDIAPHLRQQILGQSQQFAAAPDGAMATLPNVNVPPAQFGAGAPLVGRTKEDEAAAVEAAKLQTQLQYAPQQQAIETQGAIDRTVGTEQAKAQAERQKQQPKARLALDQATSRLNRVDSLVESIMPRIGLMTAGWGGAMLSNVPGTEASDLRKDLGTLQAIAGFDELNAMRAASPTGGALGNVTERELAFLQSVVRNIENSQSPEQLRRNLQDFQRELRGSWERVRAAYEQDYGGQYGPAPADAPAAGQPQSPRPGEVQDGYRFRGGDPADPGAWERL